MASFGGMPVTLVGKTKKVGDHAPNFKAINTKLQQVSLSDFKEHYVVISVVPSLDTSVCSLQTRTVNSELASRDDVIVLTISNDTPFAQKRWCGNEGLDNIVTLSDNILLEFAMQYGTLMEELRLQSRAVFVLNPKRDIIYVEYLEEMSHHPNYEKLVQFVKELPKA